MAKTVYTEKELGNVLERVMTEIETQDNFNGKTREFIPMAEILEKLYEKIGNNWKVKG
jgi:hypothetical protein